MKKKEKKKSNKDETNSKGIEKREKTEKIRK